MDPGISPAKTASQSARWTPELLERERELEEIDSLIVSARSGRGRAVVIEGAAGLGKTRLLGGFRERALRAGMRVLSARATELEREFPYAVVSQLFEPAIDAAAAEGATPAWRTALASVSPRSGPSDREADPFSTLHGLYLLAADLSQQQPLLVAVDDAHWADAPSLRLLAFLAPRVEELPIVLAVATRPPEREDPRPLSDFVADPAVTRIAPAPLGPQAGRHLLASALADAPDDSFAVACHRMTGGNPFLLVELVRALLAEGIAPTAASVPVVAELAPETVVRSVLRRLAPLPRPARDLARALAVLGDGAEARRASALSRLDPDDAAEAADALRQAEILESEPPLRFLHPLIRNAVYADFPAAARSRAHAEAAALLAQEGEPPERIALHLLATDPAGDAVVSERLSEAARAAMQRGAAQPAIAYLRRALREPPPRAARVEALELLVAAAATTADVSALDGYERELFDTLAADPDGLMRSAANLGAWLFAAGRPEEAMGILEAAIHTADEAGDLALAVALEAQLSLVTRLPPVRARQRFSRYEGRLAEGTSEHDLSLAFQAYWGSLLGEPAAKCAGLAQRALAGGRILAEAVVPAQTVLVLARADELEAAAQAAERLIASATARGSLTTLTGGWGLRAYIALRRGDVRSAQADAHQAVEAARLHSFLEAVPFFVAWLIEVLIERDELEAAQRELALSGMDGELPDGYWLGPVLFGRGRLRLAQGRARDSADDLLELRERMARWEIEGHAGLPAAGYAARALAALGEREQALALANEEQAKARRWGAASWVADATAALGAVTGGEPGIALLRDGAEAAARSPARLVHAATLVELGSALRREGRVVESRKPLRSGLDLARRCAGVAIARRAAHELEASGEKVPRYTPIGADALTPSEQRVATMAARGMTNREIAASLFVTIKTVEGHLHAAYDKLGIRSRRQLAEALDR